MKNLGFIGVASIAAALAAPGASAESIVYNSAAAPNGTHLSSGAPGCTVNNLMVSCNSFDLAGVGNVNATVTLSITYGGTVQCTNAGGNVAPGQTKFPSLSEGPQKVSPKNGKMTIPALSTAFLTLDEIKAALMQNTQCPNGKWTKSVVSDSVTLVGWSETVKFTGFAGAYLIISG